MTEREVPELLNQLTQIPQTEQLADINQPVTPDIPTVLRDKRGRVRWSLPGNTPEENLQLGTRNIQALLLEKVPELHQFLTRGESGSIVVNEDQKNEARLLILTKCGNKKDFSSLFSAARTRRSAPYFSGSYVFALKSSLEPWGINFLNRDFLASSRFWQQLNKDETIATMQQIFLEKYPEFRNFLTEDNLLIEGKQEEARDLILEKAGDREQFRRVFGSTLTKKGSSTHLNGKNDAIRALVKSWGIDLRTKDLTPGRGGLWIGKTETECVEIMQTIWLEVFPEFNQLFPREANDQFEELKREVAIKYILEKVPNFRKFVDIFGTTPLMKRHVPHFNGFIDALTKTFRPWGIELRGVELEPEIPRLIKEVKIKEDKGGRKLKNAVKIRRLHWKGKSEEEVITSLITMFRKKFPEIEELLEKHSNGLVGTNDLKALILSKIGTVHKFLSVFPVTPLLKKHVPYFNGSYKTAVMKVFAHLNVESKDEDFPTHNLSTRTMDPELEKFLQQLADYQELLRSGRVLSFQEYLDSLHQN